MEFLRSLLRDRSARVQVATSRNVGYFLRLGINLASCTLQTFNYAASAVRYFSQINLKLLGRNGRFTCLYEKNKNHLKNQKIFNFTIKDSYIT